MGKVDQLCSVQGSLSASHAAFSCEQIAAARQLSGSEAGDKGKWGGCDPQLTALQSRTELHCPMETVAAGGCFFSPHGAELSGCRGEEEVGRAFMVHSQGTKWI